MNNPSKTNLELLLIEIKAIESVCNLIVEKLTGPNDLTPEQSENWRLRGVILTESLQELCRIGRELSMQLLEREQQILTIPFETGIIQ